MMPPTSSLGSPAANSPEFRQAFIRKCHRLVGLAHRTLNAPSFQAAEETEITGELVRAMEDLVESASAPRWMHQLDVLDDPPQNAPGRQGRKRRRVDIEIRRVQAGKRPRFRFEAKRLHSSRSVGAYLGREGLTLYVTGEYAREQDEAGMLGYVQIGTSQEWAERIGDQLNRKRAAHCVCTGGEWAPLPLVPELPDTFRSEHDRASLCRSITVYHSFLVFRRNMEQTDSRDCPDRRRTPYPFSPRTDAARNM
jgi:hypothetical protein